MSILEKDKSNRLRAAVNDLSSSFCEEEAKSYNPHLLATILAGGFISGRGMYSSGSSTLGRLSEEQIVQNITNQKINNIEQVIDLIPQYLARLVELKVLGEREGRYILRLSREGEWLTPPGIQQPEQARKILIELSKLSFVPAAFLPPPVTAELTINLSNHTLPPTPSPPKKAASKSSPDRTKELLVVQKLRTDIEEWIAQRKSYQGFLQLVQEWKVLANVPKEERITKFPGLQEEYENCLRLTNNGTTFSTLFPYKKLGEKNSFGVTILLRLAYGGDGFRTSTRCTEWAVRKAVERGWYEQHILVPGAKITTKLASIRDGLKKCAGSPQLSAMYQLAKSPLSSIEHCTEHDKITDAIRFFLKRDSNFLTSIIQYQTTLNEPPSDEYPISV